MQILSIHLQNIKSHRDTTITFSAGINVLAGPNGVGKSTVFEAIGYALFGVDARDFVSNVERFLSFGAKRGEISVIFRTDIGDSWQVTRTVGTPSRWLLASESSGSFEVEEHANAEETEARIAELLGLNNGRQLAEQFKLVIGPFQNEFLGPFVIKQPTKRQEAFDEILGIDAWRKTYKGTSSLLTAIQERMKLLAAEMRLLQDQVVIMPQKEEELTGIRAALEQKRNELTEKETALKEVEAVHAELDAREKGISSLAAEIKQLEDRIKDGGEKIVTQKQRVEESQNAKRIVKRSRPGKDAYDRIEALLVELRKKEQQRRVIEKEITGLQQEAQRLLQAVTHEQEEIAKIEIQLQEEEIRHAETRRSLQADDALMKAAAQLPQLRSELDRLKGERSLLAGRRAGLEEGQEKLAEGICPFFQEKCKKVVDNTPRSLFSGKIGDIDSAMTALDARIAALGRKAEEAEAGEKELNGRAIRLQELDKQVVGLDERRKINRERAENLGRLKEHQGAAAGRVGQQQAALMAFTTLDTDIDKAVQERTRHQADRDAYTTHLKDADDLETRNQTLEKWQKGLDDLRQRMIDQQGELAGLAAGYEAERHQQVRGERVRLLTDVATQRQQIEELGKNRLRLDEEIGRLKKLQEDVTAKQAEIASYVDKEKLVKFLRNQVFKNVSTQLSERFREEISLRADRIYRIIAESDEELYWGDNYRIMLKDMHDGKLRERSDDQLSGGQIMSAVVALRLALLQTIGARIAFFDEPTSNLDAARRENLAQAFRSIDVGREEVTEHWYDQLFLVSHDVAFGEITDQMIQVGEVR
ncbi:DNA double-strand break repair Rad50 ATPase [Geobacter sp. OR-1]|uniref:AAA family ATPase n=1 Tax=Geobacter sp. OR-1 TaxID=1266765 RepID=UPI000541CDD5|nr:SMC family ATPase [Geobacter sp. OR-1]GAM09338.1 DNA double-strand break repair Rad50 ATPase [Geobacter sp. OR-1]